jgi:hypothetical protein
LDSRKTTSLIVLWIAFIASRAFAQVSISLPDHGQYRIGQFMQVDVNVADASLKDSTIELSAPGALTTTVDLHDQKSVRVPMLMIADDAGHVRWSIKGGSSGELDAPRAAVSSDEPGALAGADAFTPTNEWNPGTSTRVRRMLILSTVLVSLLLIGSVTLLRARAAVGCVFACVVIAGIGLEIARRAISPIWRAEGQIIVVSSNGVARFDTWNYLTSRSAAHASLEIPQGATPIFVDAQHARDVHARLHFDAERNILSLECDLQPGQTVATRQRRTTPSASPLPSTQPIARSLKSPMGGLARRMYVDRTTRVVDEGSVAWTDDQLVHWASVVLYSGR